VKAGDAKLQGLESASQLPGKPDLRRLTLFEDTQMNTTKLATLIAALGLQPVFAETYAPWLVQMGLTESVVSAANWGKGQLIGIVDSGVTGSSSAFAAGQVAASLSSCAAVTFRCPNGAGDDNSHGTAVAAIASANRSSPFASTVSTGAYTIAPGMVISVAPNANIVAEKVLNAAGTGYSTDVANGIRRAADAGATVINLSLTYGNSPDLVAAVNYATAKGAYIVWAGGNDNKVILDRQNSAGLTATAVQHLVFVGAVGAANGKSSFSNTAGTGVLMDTSGKSTTYASRWIMAAGEGILAPYVTAGPGAWAAWSGTSMAAPLVSGSLALLQSEWPILKTRGTAANLLLATSKDLGAAGVDATFGTGLVNLSNAFQPYGTLTVTLANGSSLPVSSLTASMISGGALGNLTKIKGLLSSYQALDSYARNYTVNLSGIIQSPAIKASVNPLPKSTRTGPNVMKLAGGGELAVDLESAGTPKNEWGFDARADSARSPQGYAVMSDARGEAAAMGFGVSARYAFAQTLYADRDIALLSSFRDESGVNGLAEGGGLVAFGTPLGAGTRIAVTWNGTAPASMARGGHADWMAPKAEQVGVGVAHRFDDRFSLGAVLSRIDERHGLLGSTYNPASPVSLGDAAQTLSASLLLSKRIDNDNRVQLEVVETATRSRAAGTLVAELSPIRARSQSMSWLSKNMWRADDLLTLSAARPLRVVSGTATLVTAGVNAETGEATYSRTAASLVPDGRERSLALAYTMPVGELRRVSVKMSVVRDSENVPGNNVSGAGLSYALKF
jgi:hypothetical protein